MEEQFDFRNGEYFTEEKAVQIKPLVLAYIGDSVYELYVRNRLINGKYRDVNQLHHMAISLVRAKSQAEILHTVEPFLSEREQDIVRRGRNAHTNTVPKNSDIVTYHHATGFEALVGFLYITNQAGRLNEILEKAFESANGQG